MKPRCIADHVLAGDHYEQTLLMWSMPKILRVLSRHTCQQWKEVTGAVSNGVAVGGMCTLELMSPACLNCALTTSDWMSHQADQILRGLCPVAPVAACD